MLTTMTRMIEEERGQIGIMKALGYSPMTIMSKYIIYAGISSLLGSAAGLAVGLYVFPTILWNTYKIMYTFPPFELFFFPEIALTSSAVAIACTWRLPSGQARTYCPKAGDAAPAARSESRQAGTARGITPICAG